MDAIEMSRWLWADRRARAARSEAGPTLNGAKGQFIETRGASLRTLIAPQKNGAGDKTLVIVPDPPNVIEQYLPIIDEMSNHARVICVETPGFGQSFVKSGFRFDVPSYCEVFDEFFAQLEIKDAVLDMACLGGFAGVAFSAARPERVRHLMLQQTVSISQAQKWAAGTDRMNLIRRPYVGQFFMRALDHVVARHWYKVAMPPATSAIAPKLAEEAIAGLDRGGCFCLCNAYQALMATPEKPYAASPRKVTIVWGDSDPTHNLVATIGDSLKAFLPEAEFVLFENCGHFPMLENPQRYLPMLRAALDAA
ncbi:alpha/beta fold hydrolase [Methylosinus sporium]|uniref:alpha/beta fold hydrolase n=1 Tax=Methylosinus sporium TaxID=428 RepID=UPI00383B4B96